MPLTVEQRDALKDSDFAVPDGRHLPIHDKVHVAMAWRVSDKTKGLTDNQRTIAKHRILHRAHELNMDTSKWHLQPMAFSAMALEFPKGTETHSNKAPFTGILTRLDAPSDKPLSNTNGKRVIISSAVAEAALPSLLGMGVDFTPKFDGHRPKVKIGLITEANVVGNAIEIAGFLYAADFPKEVATIQSEVEKMGFSFEAQSLMEDLDADPLVVEACEFTGAAVLYKDKAAYYNTSIAANAEQETQMNEEQLKAFNAMIAAMGTLTTQVTALSAAASPEAIAAAVKKALPAQAASLLGVVTPHANALRTTAAAMVAAGIGCHASAGHAVILNKMADDIESEAARGHLPAVYSGFSMYASAGDDPSKKVLETVQASMAEAVKGVKDMVDALGTQVKDLSVKVAASAQPGAAATAGTPARKTIATGDLQTLKRLGLEASGDTKLTVAQVDEAAKKANLPSTQSMALKLALKEAGALAV